MPAPRNGLVPLRRGPRSGEISFELILLSGLVALGTVLGLQTLAADTGEGALTSACRLLQKVGLGAGGCGGGGDDDGAHADPDPRVDTDLALNREAHNAEEDIVVVPQPDDPAAPRPPQMTSRHGLDEIIAAEQDARFRERFGVDLDLSEADLATLVGADPAAFRTTQTVAGIQLTEAMIPAEVRPGAPTVRPGTRVVRPLGFPANINRPPTMAPSALLRALRLTPMTALTLLHGSSGPFSRRLEHPDFQDVWFRLSGSDGGYRLSAHQCRESGILRCTLPKRLGEVELYPLQDVLPPADFEVLGLPEGAFIDPNSLQVVDLTHARSMTEWDFHFHPETLFEGFTEPRASREGERVYVFVDPNRYEVHFDPDTWTVVIRDKETGAEVPESEVTGGWLAPDGSVWSSREGGVRLDGGPGADVVVADGAATMSAGPVGPGDGPGARTEGEDGAEEDPDELDTAEPIPVPTLTPAPARLMLREAVAHLLTLPRDAELRAQHFREMSEQIGQENTDPGPGAWSAMEHEGTDGAAIFNGGLNESLVIHPQTGGLFRGVSGPGTNIEPAGNGEYRVNYFGLHPIELRDEVTRLTPASSKAMTQQALRELPLVPQDADLRAYHLQGMFRQIFQLHARDWGSMYEQQADGSHVFWGRRGEFVVIDAAGRIFRGNTDPDGGVTELDEGFQFDFDQMHRVDEEQCFAAGTLVMTPTGPQTIESLSPGDLVYARGPPGTEVVQRPIRRTFTARHKPVLRLTLRHQHHGADTLRVTYEHPFFVRTRGWTGAADIRLGDRIVSAEGDSVAVALMAEREPTTVYNLEVEELHTYFVGQTQTWVHNTCTLEARADEAGVLRHYAVEEDGEETFLWSQREPNGTPLEKAPKTETVLPSGEREYAITTGFGEFVFRLPGSATEADPFVQGLLTAAETGDIEAIEEAYRTMVEVPPLPVGLGWQMISSLTRHLHALPLDPALRARHFVEGAQQIGDVQPWAFDLQRGEDDSYIFVGKEGEAFIIAPNGTLHRGSNYQVRDGHVDYDRLTPLLTPGTSAEMTEQALHTIAALPPSVVARTRRLEFLARQIRNFQDIEVDETFHGHQVLMGRNGDAIVIDRHGRLFHGRRDEGVTRNGRWYEVDFSLLTEVRAEQCFTAGTLVHTAEGLRPIEAIQRGDLVWARNADDGTTRLRPVTGTKVTENQPILRLTLDGSASKDVLGVTPNHPFYVQERGWVPAGELAIGDQIEALQRGPLIVSAVLQEAVPKTVYNFEVESDHSYFVGSYAAWVHNDCVYEGPPLRLAEPIPGSLRTHVARAERLLRAHVEGQTGWPAGTRPAALEARMVGALEEMGLRTEHDAEAGIVHVLDVEPGSLLADSPLHDQLRWLHRLENTLPVSFGFSADAVEYRTLLTAARGDTAELAAWLHGAFESGPVAHIELRSMDGPIDAPLESVTLSRALVNEQLAELHAEAGWLERMETSGWLSSLVNDHDIRLHDTHAYDLARSAADDSARIAITMNRIAAVISDPAVVSYPSEVPNGVAYQLGESPNLIVVTENEGELTRVLVDFFEGRELAQAIEFTIPTPDHQPPWPAGLVAESALMAEEAALDVYRRQHWRLLDAHVAPPPVVTGVWNMTSVPQTSYEIAEALRYHSFPVAAPAVGSPSHQGPAHAGGTLPAIRINGTVYVLREGAFIPYEPRR